MSSCDLAVGVLLTIWWVHPRIVTVWWVIQVNPAPGSGPFTQMGVAYC